MLQVSFDSTAAVAVAVDACDGDSVDASTALDKTSTGNSPNFTTSETFNAATGKTLLNAGSTSEDAEGEKNVLIRSL